jgi:integrase
MSDHSTPKRRSRKASAHRPKKPYSDFPLSPHASGTWQKKIRGKIHYFGRWGRIVNGKMERIEGDGWEQALAIYKEQADDLHAGQTPRVKGDALTLKELCNRFLTAKKNKIDAGEMSTRMFAEYKQTTDRLVGRFGKDRLVVDLAADDFEVLRADLARQFGPVRLSNEITRVKSVFKYALDNKLVKERTDFGSEFKKPGKAVMRRHRAQSSEKMLEADDLRKLLGAADVPLKAMLLLGVNAGFGNSDCATLPLDALDLEGAWVTFPRPKTGIPRRCPLWPETVSALREAIAARPEPRHEEATGLAFINSRGRPWVLMTEKSRTDTICAQFGDLLKKLALHREGIGFYTLRHVFRTIADGALDRVAIDLIMGHSDPSMGGYYRERISDGRLVAVAEHVRTWLFGKPGDGATTGTDDGTNSSGNTEASDSADEAHHREDERPVLKLFAG